MKQLKTNNIIILLIQLITVKLITSTKCIHRDFGNGGTVCVCNDQYCDEYEPVALPREGQYVMYTSNKHGLRFHLSNGDFDNVYTKLENSITINAEKSYQTIFGWGGAFTDSTGININTLKGAARKSLLKSYFSDSGIKYNLCRVPIGGTDFSTHPYTYDDVKDDKNLEHFKLTSEDYNYKISLIKEAYELTKNNLQLIGSAWSAPAWMKTNNALSGIGVLYNKYFQLWADYHLKFLEAYDKEGIQIWGITTGNEPVDGLLPLIKINSLGWVPGTMSNWISKNLGPTIRNSKYKNIKIITLDDQRFFLPWWPRLLMKNNETRKYIDGIGVHWYWDEFIPGNVLTATHVLFPEKFLIATEACVGDKFYQKSVELGSWHRGEMYIKDIIQDVNNWITGWIDWNMALDTTGGPTYIDNNVDSPIIVNATAQEFYKQPMYYALGHFSKFVPRNSRRIHFDLVSKDIQATAFVRPDNAIVVVLFNGANTDTEVTVKDIRRGYFKINVTKKSFNTILYT